MNSIRVFFPKKQVIFFQFLKKGKGDLSPLPLLAPLDIKLLCYGQTYQKDILSKMKFNTT